MNVPFFERRPFSRRSDFSSLAMIGAGLLLPALAARLTRQIAGKSYELVAREEPPKNPADPAVAWKSAIAWTMVSGAIGGLGRVVARRLLADTPVPAEGVGLKRRLRSLVR